MIDSKRWQRYSTDPAAFRADVLIERDGEPVRRGAIVDAWQDEDDRALDAGWLRCVGRKPKGKVVQRAYLERGRGHSKTSDLAIMVVWALAFAPRVVSGVAAAADRDQSRLLRDAILRLVRLNPWLASVIEVQQYIVRNVAEGHPGRDSQLEIISSDAGSSFGLLVDFVVCDELTHWDGDGELWHSLFSAVAKKTTSLLVVISNAGRNQHACWQWDVRKAARVDASWYFHSLDGPVASWISESTLAEQQRILPPSVFKRLWLNQWTTGGDALDAAKILAAVTQSGPMTGSEPGFQFLAGLDLSTRRDRSSLVVLGAKPGSNRVRLASCQAWSAGPDGRVDLIAIREAVRQAHKRFGRRMKLYFDPYQAELMSQELEQLGIKVVEKIFTGQNITQMASAILEAFNSGSVDLYEDKALIADLTRLSIVERSFGWKLEATRTTAGHADRAMAFAIALPAAVEVAGHARKKFCVGTGATTAADVDRNKKAIVWDGRKPMSAFVKEQAAQSNATDRKVGPWEYASPERRSRIIEL